MRAFSVDLRTRIASALEHEESSFRVADRFEVSASFVRKLRAQIRRTGNLEPSKVRPAKARRIDATREPLVIAVVSQMPDATLAELCREFAQRDGRPVSEPTMCRVLQRLGITRKKRSSTRASEKRSASKKLVERTRHLGWQRHPTR